MLARAQTASGSERAPFHTTGRVTRGPAESRAFCSSSEGLGLSRRLHMAPAASPLRGGSPMRIRPTRLALLVPLAAATVGACSNPIDPATLSEQAALRAREIVHQTGGGIAFAGADDSGLRKISRGIGHAADGLNGAMP